MRTSLLLTLLVTLAGTAGAQKGPGGTVVTGELGARVEQAVAKHCPNLWGVVLVAMNGEAVFAKGYGLADRLKVRMTPNCLFDLGTSSQQLTLLAVLRLAAAKKIALADTVREHLADWPADRAAMTVQHLIDHTSGLPGSVPWTGGSMDSVRNATAAIAKAPLASPIGAQAQYSTVNANLLALVLECATAQRFEKLLVDRVCRPFGMPTAQPLGTRDSKNVTSRPAWAGDRPEPADRASYDWSTRGATGVLASALDVHGMLSATTNGKLLTEEQLAVLWRPFAAGDSYGVTAVPAANETIVRVHGTAHGYRARWLVNRTSRSWVVVLTDVESAIDALEMALAVELWKLPIAVPSPAAPTPPVANGGSAPAPAPESAPVKEAWPAAEIERFVGTFALPRGGGSFTIERSAEGLRLVGAGLQASVRVTDGGWPPPAEERLRGLEDRGLRVLERLLGTDASVERDAFATAAAGATVRRELQAWVGKHGKPKIEYVGTTFGDFAGVTFQAGAAESWFALVANERALLKARWADDAHLLRCAFAPAPPPFVAALTPVRPDVALATTRSGCKLVLTIEGRGASRRLVFEDATPGSAGLLECDLVSGG